jgi:N,N-dimethylformamidase
LPWIARPGETVQLHASLPGLTRVDIVHLACLNAERKAGGSYHGPAERIIPVAGSNAPELGPVFQPLSPGAQLTARSDGWPAWQEAGLVFALQRLGRGQGGHVLTLADAAGEGICMRLDCSDRRSARLDISFVRGGETLVLPLPEQDWLLLNLDFAHTDAVGPSLRVRSAICRATVPGGVAQRWTEHRLDAPAMPRGRAPVRLQLGSLPAAQASADVRIDLLSVLPSAAVGALSPPAMLACGSGDGPVLAEWERALLDAGAPALLLRGRTGKERSSEDLAARAAITEGQRPYAAVRGIRWDGRFQGPLQAPAHYTALHFNADSLLDAQWAPVSGWQIPADLDSGCYAFRMSSVERPDEAPSYASFFVSAAERPRHKLAVLLPTFTYLAYANAIEEMRGPVITAAPHVAEQRLDALHPAHGRSIYERHADGQGVLWASCRRPLWSVAPGNRPWGLVADSWLLDWLESESLPFDVITDHDLHRLGAAALQPYSAVLTGHHPEYTSTRMWDGLWDYLHRGGRLLYLGGNGFYWRTACDESADLIEVRRAEDGTRPSISAPGEYYCAFTGEYGGLWRRLARAPQQLVGVGMAAQGFDHAAHYRKLQDAEAPEAAFVFEGVPSPLFGQSGWWGGGASGWEIDRIDFDQGTPAGTWWLAKSEGHASSMLRTKEELLSYVPPFSDAKARSDVALAPLGDGDVFAVGSMTWIGSLHGEGLEPTDVARITANVIRRFLDPSPLPRKAER